jgi:Secretion system C-terminal sorting domain
MASPVSLSPATGYVLTSGVRGNPTGISTYTGLQRNDSLLAAYDYPIGTIAHGYNALQMNMTSIPTSGALGIVAGFSDGTSRPDGFEGGLTDELICSACSPNGTPGIPAAGQPSFNYYFATNPCSSTDGPLWVILQQSNKNNGYWSIGSPTSDNYQYWVKGIMNNFTDDGSPMGTWRILQDNNGGYSNAGVTRYYTDPTPDDWTSQITSSIPTPLDLIYYSAYTATHGATAPSCFALELNDANFGVPGSIYTGGGHFASFRENENNALPVTLVSLTATPVNNQYIQVAWQTSMEINNSGFEVERSTDGINFTDLGWVNGHGSTTTPESYTFNDNNVTAGVVYYYKLRQLDYNGLAKETNIVSAEIFGSGYFAIGNFIPNPTSSSSKIIVTTSAALTVDVKLYDAIGQQLSAGKSYNLSAGENDLDFETQDFAAGNYTAVINAGNNVYTKRLVVVKD